MWLWPKKQKSDKRGEDAACARRGDRLETAVLTCELGTIMDISNSGMRVRSPRAIMIDPSNPREIELCAPADSMTLTLRLVRIERVRGGWYEIAVSFVDLTDEQRTELENLARTGARKLPSARLVGDRRDRVLEAVRMPDYYQVLGLPANATEQQIHEAYRRLARVYHPDVCQEADAQARFCSINDAHSTLGDRARRAEYDALYRLRAAA